MEEQKLQELKQLSAKIRIDVLSMIENFGSGHIGGSLSIIELLSVLYGNQLRYDVNNPKDPTRDMVILSKGHAGPAWYATLANVGFFDREMLKTLNQGGTNLPSHPDRTKTPGVDMTTGSLGQGISVAAGVAKGFKMRNTDQYVYAVVGDGELNEGQCWEAFQFIGHYALNNCIVIIDDNKKQLDGFTKDILNPFDIVKKMEAFGFVTFKVKGNDEKAINEAIDQAKAVKDKAVCIVLDSIKGQGVSFYEEMKDNHSVKFSKEVIEENAKAIERLSKIAKKEVQ